MKFIYGSTQIDLGGNFLPTEGLKPEIWQNVGTFGDGSPSIYCRGVKVRWIPLQCRVNKQTVLNLRSFCESTIQGAKLSFTFRPDPGWDVGGSGDYGEITVNLWSPDWVEKMIAQDVYEIKLLLRGYAAI